MILFNIFSFPFQTNASFRTSLICSTGIIFILLNLFLSTIISLKFDFGTMTLLMPASITASTLDETPPIGNTSPLTDKEPVIAVSCLIGIFLKADIIEVATAMEAESPSTPS